MRKRSWILELGIILAIGVPSAWADSFTPTFTCTSCADIPTATAVSFPPPSILEMWDTSEASVSYSSGSAAYWYRANFGLRPPDRQRLFLIVQPFFDQKGFLLPLIR
jgi:hypothetical protein